MANLATINGISPASVNGIVPAAVNGLAFSSEASISNAIRLNGSDEYLSQTYTTQSTWTFDACVKRGKLDAVQPVLGY